MANNKLREVILGAVSGIIGVVIGSVATGLMTAHIQEKQQRSQAALDSFKFDQGNYPVEYIQIKQFLDEMRNLSIASSETVSKLAQLKRKYPDCSKALTNNCRAAWVESIQIMRNELDSDVVSTEDIDTVLRGKYEVAQKALERLNK